MKTAKEINECYIDYMNCKNNFKTTRKEFVTYNDAYSWMTKNIENHNIDMIKFN